MKLAIYKKDGKINNVHTMDDNKKDYSKGVLDYNVRNADKGASVEVHEFSDETRSWLTKYRGEIAIHAAKKDPHSVFRLLSHRTQEAIFKSLYAGFGITSGGIERLWTGAIVATAQLVECWHIEEHWTPGENGRDLYLVNSVGEKKSFAENCAGEMLFGDFSKGRYAWELRDVKMLDTPIPAKGNQGLWNWEEGEK